METPYNMGDPQRRAIETIRTELRRNDQPVHIHVPGEAGIGKTRLVLEATSADDLHPLVLYFDGPRQLLDSDVMTQLVRDGNDRAAILVVDECDFPNRARIWDALRPQSPRIKLVSIYNEFEHRADTAVVDAPPLDAAQTEAIIQEHGVPANDARRWAQLCDGSPRVAHVIGENLRLHPEDLLREPDTAVIWDRYVAGYDDPASDSVRQRRTVLQHVALFRRFGYRGPVAGEGRTIAGFITLADPQITQYRFEEIIEYLRNRKVLQGEHTLYITPKLLHIKLWIDWWDAHGGGDIPAFIDGLPEQIRDWYGEMFRYARESTVALRITEELLSPAGRFGDLGFFEDGRASRFFRALTEAAPDQALRTLQRTFAAWDVERLLSLDGDVRRQIVWSLEAIAVWRDLFQGAARLLLRLAEAETENISNNATGVFAELFSPGHGPVAPSEASLEERFPVLSEALESLSLLQQNVGLRAVESALQTGSFTRFIGSEYQGLRRTPELWVPKTWGEVFDGYRRVWRLVEDRLVKMDREHRERAISILSNASRGLLLMENLFDMIVNSLGNIAASYSEGRRAIVAAVETSLHYDGKAFSSQHRAELESLRARLVDADFHSQMERYVGMDQIQDYFDSNGKHVEDKHAQTVGDLAQMAIDEPDLLFAELPWLVTDAARNAYRFAEALATRDDGFVLLPRLLEEQKRLAAQNAFFLSGYFAVLFRHDPGRWESTLDTLARDETLGASVPEITWRSGMTERAALRILDLAKAKVVEPLALRMFSFGGVVRRVPENVFHQWIQFLLDENSRGAASTAVNLFHFYYTLQDPTRSVPRDLTLALLTAESLFRPDTALRRGQSDDYDWVQVANAFLNQHPGDGLLIAEKLLEHFGDKGTLTGAYNSQAHEVLVRTTKQSPAAIWQIITRYLGPPIDSRAFRLKQWLREGGIVSIPTTEVWKWVDTDVGERAWYAAAFVPSTLWHSPTEVCWARELLVRYGDRQDVRQSLHANVSTEAWTGPASSHYESRKRALEEFRATEKDKNVITWLDEEIASLNYRIEQERIAEERRF